MPPFEVTSCTIEDSSALARNNMSAFWQDETWALIWRGKTLEHVISQAARRMPNNLLTDRAHRRHQKVADITSGAIVGYIRWILPETGAGASDAAEPDNWWPTAKVPDVSEEQKREAKREYDAAEWNFDHSMDDVDAPIHEAKLRLMHGKSYLLLDYLAVHPEHKGQGIATMLVESGVREAERMGFDVFVHAKPAGYWVYKKAGFRLLEHIFIDYSKNGGKTDYGAYFLVKEFERQ